MDYCAGSTFLFSFYSGTHGDGGDFFGPGGTLAHAFYPHNGNLHFDENENWVVNQRG